MQRIQWLIGAAFMSLLVLFGVSAIEQGFALRAGQLPQFYHLLKSITPPGWLEQDGQQARAALQYGLHPNTVPLHALLGGLALILGALQFMPSLRRRYPRVHRGSGTLVGLLVPLSMLGAVSFLSRYSPQDTASGGAFHLELAGLAGTNLFCLSQAALAVLSRDFRSHMIWMAGMYATLLTAPLLRVIWLLWSQTAALPPFAQLVLVSAQAVVPLGCLAMAIWLAVVGDRDLPARAPAGYAVAGQQSAWPKSVLLLIIASTLLVVLHQMSAALHGPDLLQSLRHQSGGHMPGIGMVLWAAGSVLAMADFLPSWRRVLCGQRPGLQLSLGSVLIAGAALSEAGATPLADLGTAACVGSWLVLGLATLLFAALAQLGVPNSLGRNAWGVMLLFILLTPSQLPMFIVTGLSMHLNHDEALGAALALGTAGMAVFGLATAYGARFRLTVSRSAALQAYAAGGEAHAQQKVIKVA